MPRSLTVVAPSRLHFGLYGFGDPARRQFGGLGAMIDSPALSLTITESKIFQSRGELSERINDFAQHWRSFHRLAELPACCIELTSCPPQHVGLGVGTQLGLSVAAGLNAWSAIAQVNPIELALSVGRGKRSAVGTYGFLSGGLIAERGKLPHEAISPLDARVDIPDPWRFVLVTPRDRHGISGAAEISAFAKLPPVSEQASERLIRIARDRLLPAAVQADFEAFSSSLYQYCRGSGELFATVQGGPYNGPLLTEIVANVRSLGVTGVGQSSWGPTIFALLPSEAYAHELIIGLRNQMLQLAAEIHIARPNNRGVALQWV